MKQRYDAVNSQLGSLETRMDRMSRDQASPQGTPTRVTEEVTNPGKRSKNRKNSRMIQIDALTLG